MGSAMYFVSSSPAVYTFLPIFSLFFLSDFVLFCYKDIWWPWISFSFISGMDKGRRESMIEVCCFLLLWNLDPGTGAQGSFV